ncbi:hypothetical protein BZM27_31425 [Paraburkholderia steynii]|uniref:Short-chain dehydrogenase n=1 Tax=Paraburkholderia steynii TaxID=1245441 RepID=A0A4V2NGP7_9BURK|nr:hypothetical protein BZM27_31425 [Paraburkholderia steynii]
MSLGAVGPARGWLADRFRRAAVDSPADHEVIQPGIILHSGRKERDATVLQFEQVINVLDDGVDIAFPRRGAFGSSKAAILNFTQQPWLEWTPYGVRVNAVNPGPFREPETEWQEKEPGLAGGVEMFPLRRADNNREVA